MKKSFVSAISGVLAGAAILMCATPAVAGVSIAIGIPVPIVVAPAPYIGPQVVYGGYYGGYYGPAVQVGGPYYGSYYGPNYYGRGWREHRHEHDDHGRREGHRGSHR